MGAVARSYLRPGRVLGRSVECLVSSTTITTDGHAGAGRTVEIALTSAVDRQQGVHTDLVCILIGAYLRLSEAVRNC